MGKQAFQMHPPQITPVSGPSDVTKFNNEMEKIKNRFVSIHMNGNGQAMAKPPSVPFNLIKDPR